MTRKRLLVPALCGLLIAGVLAWTYLDPPPRTGVKVVVTDRGEPEQDANVKVVQPDGRTIVGQRRSGEGGRVTVLLPPGRYRVGADAKDGRQARAVPIEVRQNRLADVRLRVSRR